MQIISEPAIYITLTLICACLLHVVVHSFMAGLLGIRLEEASLFYLRRTHHELGNVSYRVGFLPLGSYVTPAGMFAESPDTPRLPDEYRSRPYWQRGLFSFSGVLSMAASVLLCLQLADVKKPYLQNCRTWWSAMKDFFGYLLCQTSPEAFTNKLSQLTRFELLFFTGASWLSLLLLTAILPTGTVGKAIFRYLRFYETRIGAAFSLGLLIVAFLMWSYILVMMCIMVITVYGFGMLVTMLINFLAVSLISSFIVRTIVDAYGRRVV